MILIKLIMFMKLVTLYYATMLSTLRYAVNCCLKFIIIYLFITSTLGITLAHQNTDVSKKVFTYYYICYYMNEETCYLNSIMMSST